MIDGATSGGARPSAVPAAGADEPGLRLLAPRRPRRSRRASTTTAPHGGYAALRRALELGPDGVIREVIDSQAAWAAAAPRSRPGASGRRSRGSRCARTTSICNADESEPGTFKDRVMMEGDPFALIEAMTIAGLRDRLRARLHLPARRVSARARARSQHAIAAGARARAARRRHARAGASRSTSRCARAPAPTSAARRRRSSTRSRATAASRATSRRSRSSVGLFGKPTVVNNVETLVNVLADRARRRRRRSPRSGTERSTGHASCSASPATSQRPGVYEVPFGTTLRELLELAGGVARRP